MAFLIPHSAKNRRHLGFEKIFILTLNISIFTK